MTGDTVANVRAPIAGLVLGTGYGLLCRWMFDAKPSEEVYAVAFAGVSIAFLGLVPLGLGALSASQAPKEGPQWAYWLLMPLLSASLLLATTLLLAWEGAICIVMAAPIVLGMAFLGGLLVGVLATVRGRRGAPPPAIAGCVLLPFIFAPLEARLPRPQGLRVVTTEIDIAASPEAVWSQVVRVPRIGEREQRNGFFQSIGIPRPLEARLSAEGVGGLREATFEGGLRFEERVTEWEPARRIGFTIRVDPSSYTSALLDEHVRVGGATFDVVFGRFELLARPGGTHLVLQSRHRLSTTLNAYAGLWTDAVMRDIQQNICEVIRSRSEARAAQTTSSSRSDR